MDNYHQYIKIKELVHPNLQSGDYEKIREYCQTHDVRFVDQEFPPEKSSLVKPEISKDYNHQWDNISWARADQIFGTQDYFLFNKIEPSDIR